MNKRDNIFSRLNINAKDLNLELEEVLDKKNFSEDVQSLILSMFYKIENAYADYYTIKRQMPTKEIYIENLINTIKIYCNHIEIIKSKSLNSKKNYNANNLAGKLECIENEDVLLKGLFELTKIDSNDSYDLLQEALFEALKYGNSLNYQEVIRAFNGWSWQDLLTNLYDLQINLLYQNLLILLGYNSLQEIIIANKKIYKIQKNLKELFDIELANEFVKDLLIYSSVIKANKDKEYRKDFEKHINSLKDEFEKMENKDELIVYITDKRKKITAEIGEIDKKLNNIEYLKKDFEEKNKDLTTHKKIFSVSSLAEMYETKRKKLLKEMKDYSMLVEPRKYLDKKEELKNNINIFDKIEFIQDKKINTENIMLELQNTFLECFIEKINKCNDKKQIIDLIYLFRYYLNMYYKKDHKIKDHTKLKDKLNNVFEVLVCRAERLKAIDIISKNTECNIKIIEKIFTNEIINLENIILQINLVDEKKGLYNVQYYDGAMLIKEADFNIKNTLIKKKKIRLFI